MDFPVKPYMLLLSLPFWLLGCNSSPKSTVAEAPSPTPEASTPLVSPSPEPQPSQTPAATTEAEPLLISPEGIGAAQLGMTLGELKQQLGSEAEFTVESPFIVDFDAIAVRQAGEVQYYILYLAGQPFSDGDVIQGILTENSKFQTAENIGPGTPIAEAQQAYGSVKLSYNTDNESREYARFANQPAGNISFSTGNGSTSPAGIYPSPTGTYNETEQFQTGAAIESVLVVCLTEDCVPTATSN
jgi:hypothetical protein